MTRASLALAAVLALAACKGDAPPPAATVGFPDFADLVERVSPSVVNISTVQAARPDVLADRAAEAELDAAPEWFKKFIEQHEGSAPEDGAAQEAPDAQDSLGSGFVLWADGYVLTNYHVVRDAKEIIVKLLDRRQFSAELIGSDERSDLALLKIDAKDLPAVTLGESGKLRPGEWVFAIGAPFSFDYSVTAGIVSAKGRALDTEQYVPFLQTDVPINPGNSGGPLFNLRGEVVGVNSQIYSQSGGYQGLSFSIPMDTAAKVATQLKDKGRVTRGWLGVVVQPVTRELAAQVNLKKPEGALVTRVVVGGPADRAGLTAGDIILKFNREVLPSSRELPPLVGALDPGQMVELGVVREGRSILLKLEVAVLENQDRATEAEEEAPAADSGLGLTVRPLTDAERRDAQVLSGGGVWVEGVSPGPASRAGVRTGDILLQIAGQELNSPARFAEVQERLTPGQTVQLLVQRRGAPLFLALDVPGGFIKPQP